MCFQKKTNLNTSFVLNLDSYTFLDIKLHYIAKHAFNYTKITNTRSTTRHDAARYLEIYIIPNTINL
jgi:hypothetical protein